MSDTSCLSVLEYAGATFKEKLSVLVVMFCHTSPGILTVLAVPCSLNLLITFGIQISAGIFQDTRGKTRRHHLTSLTGTFAHMKLHK